jgi:hypothetical protein
VSRLPVPPFVVIQRKGPAAQSQAETLFFSRPSHTAEDSREAVSGRFRVLDENAEKRPQG